MRLTGTEIIALLDLHAGNIVDLACEVVAGNGEVSDIHLTLDRIRELVAQLPQQIEEEEVRTVQ